MIKNEYRKECAHARIGRLSIPRSQFGNSQTFLTACDLTDEHGRLKHTRFIKFYAYDERPAYYGICRYDPQRECPDFKPRNRRQRIVANIINVLYALDLYPAKRLKRQKGGETDGRTADSRAPNPGCADCQKA